MTQVDTLFINAHVLTKDNDVTIALHLLKKGLIYGLDHIYFSHPRPLISASWRAVGLAFVYRIISSGSDGGYAMRCNLRTILVLLATASSALAADPPLLPPGVKPGKRGCSHRP